MSSTDTPVRMGAYFSANQEALRVQALLFIVGLGFLLVFLPSLSSHLRRADGGRDSMAGVVLVSGAASVVLTFVALTFTIGLATVPEASGQPALVAIMNAVFVVAGMPLAVMLAAVGVASLRTHAFPAWLAGLSGLAAMTQVIPVFGVLTDGGPLASGGWISAYLPYPLYSAWVVCVAVLLLRSARTPAATIGATASARQASTVKAGTP